MGYIGPSVINQLKNSYPRAILLGYDNSYFGTCITGFDVLPESKVNLQYFGDIRNAPESIFVDVDAVVHLAGISNDPIGNKFESATYDINHLASVNLAKKAKKMGVRSFVFASSCSIYGAVDESSRKENDVLNPLTAYAKSKMMTEKDIEVLADERFLVTNLRFSTACGWSDRLRLDLVLNDFVAGAIASKKITLLSNGESWRPLIHIRDMARAIEWAIQREKTNDFCLTLNVGSDEWNYRVISLAKAVTSIMPDVEIIINQNAQPDKRSYRVNFDLFKKLAPQHQPQLTLTETINELKNNLLAINFKDQDYRNSNYIRLNTLISLQSKGLLDKNFQWM